MVEVGAEVAGAVVLVLVVSAAAGGCVAQVATVGELFCKGRARIEFCKDSPRH